MTIKTHEFYDCVESEGDQLFVDCYPDKVYFEIMVDEGEGIFLNRERGELLVLHLSKWLEDRF